MRMKNFKRVQTLAQAFSIHAKRIACLRKKNMVFSHHYAKQNLRLARIQTIDIG